MNPYIALSTAVLSDYRLIDPELFTTYVRGLLYSKVHQTDGFIPAESLPLVTLGVTRDVTQLVTKLVTSGLWIECESGYTVGAEKWAKWQETKGDDEKRRAYARDRQRAKRERDAEKLAQFLAGKGQEQPDSVTRDSRVSHSEVTVQRREEKRREESKDITTPTPSEKTEEESQKPNGSQRKKFVKPTAQEVADYSKEISLPLSEGRGFFDYQESKGWKVGNAPMVDWKASVRTWKGNWEKRSKPSSNGVHTPTLTAEEAGKINSGEGLPDYGSPVRANHEARRQN